MMGAGKPRPLSNRSLQKVRIYQRKRKAKLRKRGLCTHCGRVRPVEGKTRCQRCIDAGRKSAREGIARRRKGWVALGLCPCCSGARIRMPGRSQCAVCAEERDERRERKSLAARSRAAAIADPSAETALANSPTSGTDIDPEREAA